VRAIRNPKLVTQAIQEAMLIVSDLRVGQLLANAMQWYNEREGKHSRFMDKHGSPDLYYVEDIELANIIQMYVMSLDCPKCAGKGGKHFLDCPVWEHNQKKEAE